MFCPVSRRDAQFSPAGKIELGCPASLLPAFLKAGKPCPLGLRYALLETGQASQMKLIIFERNVDFSQSMLLWRGYPNVNEHLDGEFRSRRGHKRPLALKNRL